MLINVLFYYVVANDKWLPINNMGTFGDAEIILCVSICDMLDHICIKLTIVLLLDNIQV